MFSALLATCLPLHCFGLSSEPRACVWPHHLFLIQTWEVNSCLGRRLMHTHTHTHCIIHLVSVDSVTIHSVTIRMILYLLQFVSSVATNASTSFGDTSFLTHSIIIEIIVGHKASNCFFICSVIDCVDWLTRSERLSVALLTC